MNSLKDRSYWKLPTGLVDRAHCGDTFVSELYFNVYMYIISAINLNRNRIMSTEIQSFDVMNIELANLHKNPSILRHSMMS